MPQQRIQLRPGDPAPVVDVTGRDGLVSIAMAWADGPVVLTFLRHFGWVFCRELLARFEQARSRFQAAGMRAVAVAMCRPDEARAFCGRHAPSVTCLCDASKHAYAAYGLTRAGLREVFGPEVVAAGIRATLGGHVQGRTVGDPMMMPGTFAIDQAGIIHAAHYARHAGDQPDLRAMLAALYRPQ